MSTPARAGGRFAVFGASQGGQAALFTGQEAASYAPELKLLGVAAAAPATDLKTLFEVNRNGTFGRILSAYTIDTWSRVYPRLRVDQLVTRLHGPWSDGSRDLRRPRHEGDGCRRHRQSGSQDQLSAYAPVGDPAVEESDRREQPRAREDPRAGSHHPGRSGQAHPPADHASLRATSLPAGENVSYRVYPGLDHIHAGPKSASDVAKWIADRLARKPAQTACT